MAIRKGYIKIELAKGKAWSDSAGLVRLQLGENATSASVEIANSILTPALVSELAQGEYLGDIAITGIDLKLAIRKGGINPLNSGPDILKVTLNKHQSFWQDSSGEYRISLFETHRTVDIPKSNQQAYREAVRALQHNILIVAKEDIVVPKDAIDGIMSKLPDGLIIQANEYLDMDSENAIIDVIDKTETNKAELIVTMIQVEKTRKKQRANIIAACEKRLASMGKVIEDVVEEAVQSRKVETVQIRR